jgi:cellulose synthase/poly-beta-1,6-N-acetylglucosamine synthase-like glycosyltransferase
MAGLAALVFLLITLNATHPFFILGVLLMASNLIASTLLKAIALLFSLQSQQPSKRPFEGLPDVLPKVSILIPLYREKNIAAQLINNLEKLNYPRSHLEIILVLERHDTQTKACLAAIELPKWIRVIQAAPGTIKTKPRALNYALPFCSGEIIGVLDAEDAPEPDQLRSVVTKFSSVSAKTVCLQGRLDYYNPQSNWLARCFTMEYASWFRIMLPALAQIGFAIPLGGTTLYFRRSALVELGGWDAHNVTEDADLGIRLARAGYRCAMIETTTFEEANNKPLSWVQQRSRWIKGYFMTYVVHMRSPKTLLRDLGI